MTENKQDSNTTSDNVHCVNHDQIVSSLREFADYLESLPPHNRPDAYSVGGWQEHMFLDWRLHIRAEVVNPSTPIAIASIGPNHTLTSTHAITERESEF